MLSRTLDAIVRLHVPAIIDWGVLVVNNHCTDDTASLVERYVRLQTIPIRMVMETKPGLTEARLCGVKNTSRQWIAFIDDDCLLADDWLARAAEFINVHPLCGMFGSRIQLVFEKEPPAYVHRFPFAYAGKNHGDTAKPMHAVAGAGMVVSRLALGRSGWIDHQLLADRIGRQLSSGGDMEIALRVAMHFELWYNPLCRLQHIIPERRTTREYLRRMLFGLGASRFNVNALQWRSNYYAWMLFAFIYSLGMFGMGLSNSLKDFLRQEERAGFRIAFSPFLGWNAAMRTMLIMNPAKRLAIIGAACKMKK